MSRSPEPSTQVSDKLNEIVAELFELEPAAVNDVMTPDDVEDFGTR